MDDKRNIEISKGSTPVTATALRHSPFGVLRREIDRLFDDFALPDLSMPLIGRLAAVEPARSWVDVWTASPAMDLLERDTEYEVQAELPGLGPSDIEVKLSDGMLTIKGEKSADRTEEDVDFHLRERSYGAFQRIFRLPQGIDAQAISARFENGVLSVHLPKTAEAKEKERRILVTSA